LGQSPPHQLHHEIFYHFWLPATCLVVALRRLNRLVVAIICFACLPGAACARVHAEATAIDLARPQVDKLKRRRRHAAFSCSLDQGLYGICDVRKDRCWVAHSVLHDTDTSPFSYCFLQTGFDRDGSAHWRSTGGAGLSATSVGFRSSTTIDGIHRRNVTDSRISMAGVAMRGSKDARFLVTSIAFHSSILRSVVPLPWPGSSRDGPTERGLLS
jgi:hypothetical protein